MSEADFNIESRLCAYIDGLLDAEQREHIEQYLDRYPEHRQLIDQLMQERALLRDLPKEKSPADVLGHFQGQLERSVLLDDLDLGAARNGRGGKGKRWNLAALLAFLMLVGGAGVIVWIAMPPKRGHQVEEMGIMPEAAATLPVDTTQTTQPVTTSEPVKIAFEEQVQAMLMEPAGSSSLIVMISTNDVPAAEKRVAEFLKNHSLSTPTNDLKKSQPTTTRLIALDDTLTHDAWNVPGMTRMDAEALVAQFSAMPVVVNSATNPTTNPATTRAVSTTSPAATQNTTTAQASDVMIIFQTTGFSVNKATNPAP